MNFEPIRRDEGHFQQSLKLDDIVKVCSIAFAEENKMLEIEKMESGFITIHIALQCQGYAKGGAMLP
ncbi:hypothetical protein [Candidatus Pristimantibacillus sp. PTI5]|uniref:hypothetical protein n=1 Tax=Candidatus Pristimantibacillus sp. PTI5 TaxID=3400422 RepID=UPI003B028D45